MLRTISNNKMGVLLFVFCMFGVQAFANAGLSVIANNQLSLESLEIRQVRGIFLAKTNKFPNGVFVKFINQTEGSPVANEFDKKVLRKTVAQLKSYWMKLVYTGRARLPGKLASDAEVKKWVAAAVGRIGYIDSASVDNTVKVLAVIP